MQAKDYLPVSVLPVTDRSVRNSIEVQTLGSVTALHLLPSPVWKELAAFAGDAFGEALPRPAGRNTPAGAGPWAVVDFRSVPDFSAGMVALLVRLHARQRALGGAVALCHVPVWFDEVLRVTRLDRLFRVFADQPEAICSLLRLAPRAPRLCVS